MKYLKFHLDSLDGCSLYERDVKAWDVFSTFIRTSVMPNLVASSTLNAGDLYCAVCVPRYGDYLQRNPVVEVNGVKIDEAVHGIELRFEEPLQRDRRVRYFTIEIRMPRRSLVLRQDFRVEQIAASYAALGVEPALVKLGVLKEGDRYQPVFFACDDDEGRFDQENIPALDRQAASLIELEPEAESSMAVETRSPEVYGKTEEVGSVQQDDIRIYVRRFAMNDLLKEGKLSTRDERGGILVGNIFKEPNSDRFLIEVSDLIVSSNTVSSVYELRYTFESWRGHQMSMKENFPGQRIVGWYHTHLIDLPIYRDDSCREIERTTMFFSHTDVFLHTQFFPDPWYVALVIDPAGNTIFFQWRNGKIVPGGGYFIFDEMSSP